MNEASSFPPLSQIYPRQQAVRVLTRVLSDHQPLDDVLDAAMTDLSSAQVGWLQEVCSGTLRWKGRLDWILDSVALKKKPSGWLRKILLLTAYQLIVQDRTHAGAVVSETVSEVRAKEGEAPAKFANACLRKISEHAVQWRNLPYPSDQGIEVGAAWASLPVWLWKKLVKQYGVEWATGYAQASLERPVLWLRSKRPDWSSTWTKPGPIPCSWQAVEGGRVINKSGFSEGEIFVQDISSQILIAEVTTRVRESLGEKAIQALDLCSAPGGKAVGLAWNGIQVLATEKMIRRVSLLQQTLARTGADVEYFPWEDLSTLGTKDLVWVDAPCTGTGILRRHPDVRWLREEKELKVLAQSQEELLKSAWEKVSPGGFLVYSVCSVLQEEGPCRIEKLDFRDRLVQSWLLSPQDPPSGDGFWAALFHKEKGTWA